MPWKVLNIPGAKTTVLTPKSYDDHPSFLYDSLPPPSPPLACHPQRSRRKH